MRFFRYFPAEKHNLIFEWRYFFLYGFDIFIHILNFIILLLEENIAFYFTKKFLLEMISS